MVPQSTHPHTYHLTYHLWQRTHLLLLFHLKPNQIRILDHHNDLTNFPTHNIETPRDLLPPFSPNLFLLKQPTPPRYTYLPSSIPHNLVLILILILITSTQDGHRNRPPSPTNSHNPLHNEGRSHRPRRSPLQRPVRLPPQKPIPNFHQRTPIRHGLLVLVRQRRA